MKFINKAKFLARIKERFAPVPDGWLYNHFFATFGCHS